MRFWVHDHLGKARSYITALQKSGHQRVTEPKHADLFLLDVEHRERRGAIGYAEAHDLPVVIYPHGGNPPYGQEPGYLPTGQVRVQFVAAPGHVQWHRQLEPFPRNYVVSGFPFCPQAPYKPCPEPETVVFAPLHPSAQGFMCQELLDANLDAQQRIQGLFPRAKVIVSLNGSLEQNGLTPVPDWLYRVSDLQQGTLLIDLADLVVAVETFAYQAVARGKPTVMFRFPCVDWDGRQLGADDTALMGYPYRLDDEDTVMAALLREASEWRQQMVGPPFQAQTVAKACQRALRTRTSASSTRSDPVPQTT